jgi:hypothetical protein
MNNHLGTCDGEEDGEACSGFAKKACVGNAVINSLARSMCPVLCDSCPTTAAPTTTVATTTSDGCAPTVINLIFVFDASTSNDDDEM